MNDMYLKKKLNQTRLPIESSVKIYTDIDQYSEKVMAPHSSTLAWKIPWMEEPGGLWSVG